MEIYSFHLMPWPNLPTSYDGTAWISLPNSLFDPAQGHRILNNYLDQLVACEALGFDGVGVNEHHQTAWGMMVSPNLGAGLILSRTKRLKVLSLGPALPLYIPPIRIAEELALLDVISKGRIIAGAVIGGPPEYYAAGIPPGEARGRFQEALQLILDAWTKPGPFEHHGEYFHYQYVNPFVRPYQKPHPPVWVPGVGSLETIQMCAERGFTYSVLPFLPRTVAEKSYDLFRQAWVRAERKPDPSKLSMIAPIYVSDTDKKARDEFEKHFWYFRRLQKGAFPNVPGYMTETSVLRMLKANAPPPATWEQIIEAKHAIVGSPSTVFESLCERISRSGVGSLMGMFQVGSMPHEMAMNNLAAFSEHVMPRLRATFPNGPGWNV